jgi:hypothetical protein
VASRLLFEFFLHVLCVDNGTVLTGLDCLLWAVGRTPNTDKLNCQAAGIQLDKVGVKVLQKRFVLYYDVLGKTPTLC